MLAKQLSRNMQKQDLETTEEEKIAIALPYGCQLGEYRVLNTLGQGGFGITYRAEHIATGKKVVIKENLPAAYSHRHDSSLTIAPTGSGKEKELFEWALERFLDEARLLAQLNHPNIVRVTDAFTALGTAYYVMEQIDGGELYKESPEPKDITEQWLHPVLVDILQALEYVHSCGLMHRDIKPNNILLDRNQRAILIDFGTARSLLSERSATMLESPGYTPLEQLQSHGAKGPWVDIYSLGATCYKLITGNNPPRCLDRLSDPDPCTPLATQPELQNRFSAEFLQGIDRALSLKHTARWQSATEWLNYLNNKNVPEQTEIKVTPIDLPQQQLTATTQSIAFPPPPQSHPTPTAPNLPPFYSTPLQKSPTPTAPQPIPPPPLPIGSAKKSGTSKGGSRLEWWISMLIAFIILAIAHNNQAEELGNGLFLLIYFVASWRRARNMGIRPIWGVLWIVATFVVSSIIPTILLLVIIIPGLIKGRKSKEVQE